MTKRTVYIVAEDGDIAEYIYIDGKPFCIGRSDIFNTIKDLLERVEKLENQIDQYEDALGTYLVN